jgi:hypothetical protein
MGVTVLHHHAVGSKVTGMPPLPPQSDPNSAESGHAEARPPLSLAWVTGGRQRDPAPGSVVMNVPYRYHGAASPCGWATRCRNPPRPGPRKKCLDEVWIPPSPPRWPVEVHIVAYPGAQLSGMVHMGNTVPLCHAVGPHVADIPPTPHPKKLLERGLLSWIALCCSQNMPFPG